MRFREFVFVLFVIFFGLLITLVARYQGCAGLLWRQQSYSYPEEETTSCPSYSFIKIDNRFGDVRVSSWDRALLSATLTKQIWAPNKKKAKGIADQLKLILHQEGDVYQVSTNRDELNNIIYDFQSDLHLMVPLNSQVMVENQRGEVEIRGLAGDQEVRNTGDNILATDIDGNLVIKGRDSDIVVEDIKGGLTVNNLHGDVTVTKVEGELLVENPYGDVEADEIGGNVRIITKHSSILLSKIGRDIEVIAPHSRVWIREVEGSLRVETSNEPVSVEGFQGEVIVKTTNAAINLYTSALLAGGIRAVNSNGNITLSLPEAVSFQIEAIALEGRVISDFQDPNLRLSQQEGSTFLTGTYREGGPQLYLKTEKGDIILKKIPSAGVVEEPSRPED